MIRNQNKEKLALLSGFIGFNCLLFYWFCVISAGKTFRPDFTHARNHKLCSKISSTLRLHTFFQSWRVSFSFFPPALLKPIMSSLGDKFSVYSCHKRDLKYLQTIVLKCMQVSWSWLLPVFHDVKTSFSRTELSTGMTSCSTFVDHSGYRFSFSFQCLDFGFCDSVLGFCGSVLFLPATVLEDYGVWITCWEGNWRSVHTASPQKKWRNIDIANVIFVLRLI